MNPEFRNIFPVSSRGFSGQIPVGIVPSPVGLIENLGGNKFQGKYGIK
jgi:hypothetical protein